jgi:2-hydroxycyclohexanecarboxyl-CoA dehydrogenase
MRRRLDGKIAIITGGSGGIGSATSELFCAEGARVGIVDQDGEAALRLARTLTGRFGAGCAIGIQADVASEAEAHRAVSRVIEQFGGLTSLVNNAGIREYTALAEASRESWLRIIDVNLLGATNCTRAALPMLRTTAQASIVNVSSTYGVVGRGGMGQYDATKAALLSITRTLAFEEAAHGIRVNAVCPGGTLTPYHRQRFAAAGRTEAEVAADQRNTTLLKRWAEPHEIAYPIVFLASDEASFITGTALMVDGGKSAM